MSLAKQGDTVQVHYTGRLGDGSVFDTSEGREPLRFTLGQQHVIPGFENAVVGMEPGQSKTFTIDADDAYGSRREELVLEFDRNSIPDGMDPQVGQSLQLQTDGGRPVPARVVDVNEKIIKVDANHPLAGQNLTFDIELVSIGESE